jgi:hypothetical protein
MAVKALQVLVGHLVHDAALYPPGNAPMAVAVTEHASWRAERRGEVVGPFLCPAGRLAELQAQLSEGSGFDLALLGEDPAELAAATTACRADERLLVSHLEVSLGPGPQRETLTSLLPHLAEMTAPQMRASEMGVLQAGGSEMGVFVEIPRTPGWEASLDLLASSGCGAKLRTGGLTAAAFPSEEEVAAFLHASYRRNLAVKLTAGLHRAGRHRDPETGFEHHGFLNILLGCCGIVAGASVSETTAVLGEREPSVLAHRLRQISLPIAERARALLVGYGSCSLSEPYDELSSLGLLDEPR